MPNLVRPPQLDPKVLWVLSPEDLRHPRGPLRGNGLEQMAEVARPVYQLGVGDEPGSVSDRRGSGVACIREGTGYSDDQRHGSTSTQRVCRQHSRAARSACGGWLDGRSIAGPRSQRLENSVESQCQKQQAHDTRW